MDFCQRGDLLQRLKGQNYAGGVGGGVDNDSLGFISDGVFDIFSQITQIFFP